MDKAITHFDRDNDFTVTLKKNGTTLTALEMGDITKFEIKYSGSYYNSVDNPTGFTITDATGSILVKPNDSIALAEAIERGLNKTWDKERIIKHVRSFSWEKRIEEFEKVYRYISGVGKP